MAYVDRDAQNRIIGIYQRPQFGGQEFVPDDSPLLAKGIFRERDQARAFQYDNLGITPEKMIVALWEKVMENKSAAADALQGQRQQVKSQIP